jgi:hypothetical protein
LRREDVAVLPPFAVLLVLQQSPEPASDVAMVPTPVEARRVETASTLVRSEPLFRQMLEPPASPRRSPPHTLPDERV